MKEKIEELEIPEKPKKYLTMFFRFSQDYRNKHKDD